MKNSDIVSIESVLIGKIGFEIAIVFGKRTHLSAGERVDCYFVYKIFCSFIKLYLLNILVSRFILLLT